MQSGGDADAVRRAGCSRRRCWCAARPPGRSATSTRTSSSTRTRPTSASGSATPAGGSCTFPRRGPSTTTSSPPTRGARERRMVEFHRNRDLYMRKHHSRPAALAVRVLTAWSYAVRALVAPLLRDASRAGTGCTRARRCARRAARGCGRRRRPTTAVGPSGVSSGAAAVLVAALDLVDLLGRAAARGPPARSAATAGSGGRARAGCAGSRRPPRAAASRDQRRCSSGVRNRPPTGRAGTASHSATRPSSPTAPSVGSSSSPAGDQHRGGAEDQRQPPPLVGDREEPLREHVHQHQHDQVGGDERDRGADDPVAGGRGPG